MAITPGPKKTALTDPLDVRALPRHRGARHVAFIERHLRIPSGKDAKRRVRLRDWQRGLILGSLRPGIRTALWSMGRGNSKSTTGAMLGTASLFLGGEGAQVLMVASGERQAGIPFRKAWRMIEMNPVLRDRCKLYSDRIEYVPTNSLLVPLPATEEGLQGFDPTLVLVDELAWIRHHVWESMVLSAKQPRSLVLGISTSPIDKESVMYSLVELGRAGTDKSFYFREWVTPEYYAIDDPKGWALANPALGSFLPPDAVESNLPPATREPMFRRFRLNQMVEGVGSWLGWDAWDVLADEGRQIDPDEPIVLGFDGSVNDDSTALIGCTVREPHHIFVAGLWEKDDDPAFRVDRDEVGATVARWMESYRVLELACDPYRWEGELVKWQKRWGDRVISWPSNSLPRMGPATDKLYTAVMEREVTHDGSADLSRHVRNCQAKPTSFGDVVVKDRKGSPRKIDGAVSSIVAHDRAVWHAANPPKKYRTLVVA